MDKRKIKRSSIHNDGLYISYRAVRDIHTFLYFLTLITYFSSVFLRFPLYINRPFLSELILIAGIFGVWFLSLMLHIWFVNRVHRLQATIQRLENEQQSQEQHQDYQHLMNEDDYDATDEKWHFQAKSKGQTVSKELSEIQ